MPQGEPVAAFSRREEAFAAFDVLAAANYPITALYLVNEGLKQVEYPHPAGVRPSASGRSYPGYSCGSILFGAGFYRGHELLGCRLVSRADRCCGFRGLENF